MTFEELKKEILSDPKKKRLYEEIDVEYEIAIAISCARDKIGMTQQQLSKITGIDRSDISRLENAEANPTLSTLQKIADALGKKLEINFK